MMPGHKQRMSFLDALRTKFGDEIDVFGHGIKPVDDKAEGLLSYQFCICIENSAMNDYWTEKIADSFLSYCVPIYYGCKNINKYFDDLSVIKIDINNPKQAIRIINNILLYSDKIYTEKIPYLNKERNKILYEFNIFNELIKFYKNNVNNSNAREIKFSIAPSESFRDHHLKMIILNCHLKIILRTSVDGILVIKQIDK